MLSPYFRNMKWCNPVAFDRDLLTQKSCCGHRFFKTLFSALRRLRKKMRRITVNRVNTTVGFLRKTSKCFPRCQISIIVDLRDVCRRHMILHQDNLWYPNYSCNISFTTQDESESITRHSDLVACSDNVRYFCLALYIQKCGLF